MVRICSTSAGPAEEHRSRSRCHGQLPIRDRVRLDEVSRGCDVFLARGSGYRFFVVVRVAQHAGHGRADDSLGEMTAREAPDLRGTCPRSSIMASSTWTGGSDRTQLVDDRQPFRRHAPLLR
jgi:hypothetical protein